MKKINIGFIGLGRMGLTHLSIIKSDPRVEIIAVCDPSKFVNSLFSKYFPNIKYYKDYNDLINDGQLDGIIVSTPPNMHFDIVKKALEKNISVFAEKPFTLNFNESNQLSNIAENNSIINQVGYVNRFNDMFKKAKELVDNQVIGKIIRFKSEMFSYTISKEEEGGNWRNRVENGGGCLNEMASHAIDLVCYIIGEPKEVKGSILNQVYSKNVDDIVSTTFLYDNGIAGTLYVNWCDPSFRKPTNKLEIFGSEGKIVVDQHDLKIYLKNDNSNYRLNKGWNTIYITDIFSNVPFYVRGNEFTSQLYHFTDCVITHNTNNLCSFNDATKTQKIINKIRNNYLNN